MNDSSIRITADGITISGATTEREQFVTDHTHASDFFGSTTASGYHTLDEWQTTSAWGSAAHAEGDSRIADSYADVEHVYPLFNYCEYHVCPMCRRQSAMLCSTHVNFCAFCGQRL